ncbi:MAG TPA: hypothetical protein VFQ39_05615 [Longimicrobium sp.]|nr:hypothetical protein [Longimicrobium sp.]
MKNKLRLDPDALRVVSFVSVEERDERGTVLAQSYTQPGYPSCDRTCGASPPPPSDLICRMSGTCPQQCCL